MSNKILKSLFLVGAVSFLSLGSSGAYFSDTAVVSGNTFKTGTWKTLFINEVFYDGTKEWIELKNTGDEPVNLKDWKICDSTGSCRELNGNKSIPAGGFALIVHDEGTLNDWTVPKSAEVINYSGTRLAFNDEGGDSVILKNEDSEIVDQMSYEEGAAADDHSLVRQADGSFKDNPSPNPGA